MTASLRAWDISEAEVSEALERLDSLWDELFPAEQARIVQLLVERRCQPRRYRHPLADRRIGEAGRRTALEQTRISEGGVMTRRHLADDRRTVTARIPISIRRRRGRKFVIAPDGRTRRLHEHSAGGTCWRRAHTRPSRRSRLPRKSTLNTLGASFG
jgi:hypothetical protein